MFRLLYPIGPSYRYNFQNFWAGGGHSMHLYICVCGYALRWLLVSVILSTCFYSFQRMTFEAGTEIRTKYYFFENSRIGTTELEQGLFHLGSFIHLPAIKAGKKVKRKMLQKCQNSTKLFYIHAWALWINDYCIYACSIAVWLLK